MNSRKSVFLLCLVSAVGCQKGTEESQSSAVISNSRLELAEEILQESSLMSAGIPFQFAEDGCYARALLMSAKLAAADIPSSSLFAFADPSKGESLKLTTATGQLIQWRYHVAPLFFVSDNPFKSGQIIDPSVNQGRATPMDVSQWLGKFDGNKSSVKLIMTPGSCYAGSAENAQLCTSLSKELVPSQTIQSQMTGLVSSVRDMPKFSFRDLNNACIVLGKYNISRMKPKTIQNSNKILSKNLSTLVRLLESKGLTKGNRSDFSCELSFVDEAIKSLPQSESNPQISPTGQPKN